MDLVVATALKAALESPTHWRAYLQGQSSKGQRVGVLIAALTTFPAPVQDDAAPLRDQERATRAQKKVIVDTLLECADLFELAKMRTHRRITTKTWKAIRPHLPHTEDLWLTALAKARQHDDEQTALILAQGPDDESLHTMRWAHGAHQGEGAWPLVLFIRALEHRQVLHHDLWKFAASADNAPALQALTQVPFALEMEDTIEGLLYVEKSPWSTAQCALWPLLAQQLLATPADERDRLISYAPDLVTQMSRTGHLDDLALRQTLTTIMAEVGEDAFHAVRHQWHAHDRAQNLLRQSSPPLGRARHRP